MGPGPESGPGPLLGIRPIYRVYVNDDPLRQAEAHRYQRARRRLGLASNVVELVALVAIVAATGAIGGRWAVALLVVGTFVLGLPFGIAGYRLSDRKSV